ncbi:hypothetical protein SJ05684_b49990 (plasmid) [Sinorhizobium sojae CCBAU 05684]|uniref:Uncharacterized protein n=1 Tax=Sinorhizobium sojae CCBAU 05684 TaxID=716928 RepID=A0A249PJ96_9HYPH|nr:hypothetical protein [Sinorhizobium sojae]ASY65981.1 hypothetical protein SJ05684_b49990 [Sinorhizobium sojae CCBAU 05684]
MPWQLLGQGQFIDEAVETDLVLKAEFLTNLSRLSRPEPVAENMQFKRLRVKLS